MFKVAPKRPRKLLGDYILNHLIFIKDESLGIKKIKVVDGENGDWKLIFLGKLYHKMSSSIQAERLSNYKIPVEECWGSKVSAGFRHQWRMIPRESGGIFLINSCQIFRFEHNLWILRLLLFCHSFPLSKFPQGRVDKLTCGLMEARSMSFNHPITMA